MGPEGKKGTIDVYDASRVKSNVGARIDNKLRRRRHNDIVEMIRPGGKNARGRGKTGGNNSWPIENIINKNTFLIYVRPRTNNPNWPGRINKTIKPGRFDMYIPT